MTDRSPRTPPALKRLMRDTLDCPFCGADLRASKIPEASRHMYGEKQFFSRLIVIVDRDLDRAVANKCQDCGVESHD